MAITRIKNNQIFDNTIDGGTKILDLSIPGGKLVEDLTYGSNLTVTGNLVVNGTTTTIDTTSTTVEDAVIVLASTQTAALSDIGILGNRGSDSNVAFIWDESQNEFVFIFTNDPDQAGGASPNLTRTAYANITANVGTFSALSGDLSFPSLDANAVVFLNAAGELSTDGNLEFDGSTLTLDGVLELDNLTLDGTSISSNAALTLGSGNNGDITIAPGGTGSTIISALTFADLDADRIVYTGADGVATVSANLTFDGADLVVVGSAKVDNVVIDGATISVDATDADLVLAPNGTGAVDVSTSKIINVVDPTNDQDAATKKYVDDQIGTGGFQISQDDTSIVVDDDGVDPGSITTTVDNAAVIVTTADETTFTQDVIVDGSLTVDNVTVDGNTISTSTGDLVLSSDTGVIQVGGTATQVFFAGAAGELDGDANLTWNGSTLVVTGGVDATTVDAGDLTLATTVISSTGNITLTPTANVVVSNATATEVFFAGANKELIGNANLTFDGTTLESVGGVTGGNITIAADGVTGSEGVTIASGNDGNIVLSPDGNGVVIIENLQVSGATTPYQVVFTDGAGQLATDGNLTFDGDDLVLSPLGTATLANVVIAGATINTLDDDETLTVSANGTGEFYVDRNMTISGDLSVLGTTTTVNSTVVTIADPIIELGRGANDAALTGNDGKDRGVRLWYWDIAEDEERSAWMGYDHPTHEFRYFDNAQVSDEEVTGDLGHIRAGMITLINDLDPITGGGTWVQIDEDSITSGGALQIISGLNEDITLNANGTGKVVVPTGDQFRVADLDVDRVVYTTSGGELVTTANLTFDGDDLVLDGSAKVDNVTIDGTSITSDAGLTIASADGENVTITGTGAGVVVVEGISVDGATVATTGTDADLVLAPNGTGSIDASTSKIINVVDPTNDQDAATKAYVDGAIGTGGYQISQDNTSVVVDDDGVDPGTVTTTVDNVAVIVTTADETTFNHDVVISSATPGELFFAGAGGELVGSEDLTWDGANLTVDGDVFATSVTGGNITIATDGVTGSEGVAITSGNNGNIDITPDGTGVVNITNLAIDNLDANRVVVTNASGAFVDDDNFTYDVSTSELLLDGTATIGNVTISGDTIDHGGNLTIGTGANLVLNPIEDVIVETATATEVFFAGANKELVGDASLTFDGTVLTSTGGVTAGNIEIAGDTITGSNGVVAVNEAGDDVDFVVYGEEANSTIPVVLAVDAADGAVVVGSNNVTVGATFKVDATDSMMLPVGTTAERPDVPESGMLRFNETIGDVEFFDGTMWKPTATEFTLIASETFNGDDSTEQFTLAEAATTASVIVSINGVLQQPTVAYSVSGTTLTFNEAPATGDVIEVRRLTTTTVFSLEVVNSAETARLTASESGAYLEVTGDLIPTANETFDLGSSTFKWNDLYLSGSTIYLGDKQIKVDNGDIKFFESDGITIAPITAALSSDIEIDGGEY